MKTKAKAEYPDENFLSESVKELFISIYAIAKRNEKKKTSLTIQNRYLSEIIKSKNDEQNEYETPICYIFQDFIIKCIKEPSHYKVLISILNYYDPDNDLYHIKISQQNGKKKIEIEERQICVLMDTFIEIIKDDAWFLTFFKQYIQTMIDFSMEQKVRNILESIDWEQQLTNYLSHHILSVIEANEEMEKILINK